MTSPSTADFALAGPDDTDRLGRWLADSLPPRGVVFLHGDLGAGKSTLARAMLQRLGVTGPVKSPTYTLIERYPLPQGEAAHLDLYRIAAAGELDFLGLDDVAAQARLWLVEWPERGAGSLPAADLRVSLAMHGAGRLARVEGLSAGGRAWLAAISKMAGSGGSV
jgi:tRNA threonylcarbamoyl adenosine modification protein YjeE